MSEIPPLPCPAAEARRRREPLGPADHLSLALLALLLVSSCGVRP